MKKIAIILINVTMYLSGTYTSYAQCNIVSTPNSLQAIGTTNTAQSFTPICDSRVTSLQIFDPGNLTIFDSLEIRIGEGTNGDIVHTAYFTSITSNPKITFSEAVDLKSNTLYSFVFYRAQGALRGSGNSASYSGGSLYRNGNLVPGDMKFTFEALNASIFDSYNFFIDENSNNGIVLGTLDAFNPENATVTYELLASGNTNNAFQIDSNGELTVANSSQFDDEVIPRYNLTVKVTAGTIVRNVSVAVNIQDTDPLILLEENFDNQPTGQLPRRWSPHNLSTSQVIVADGGVDNTNALTISTNSASNIGFITPQLTQDIPATLSFKIRQAGAARVDFDIFTMNSIDDPNPVKLTDNSVFISRNAFQTINNDGTQYVLNLRDLDDKYILISFTASLIGTNNYTVYVDNFSFKKTEFTPEPQLSIKNQLVQTGYGTLSFDFNGAFTDGNGDPLTITATSSDTQRATVAFVDDELTITEGSQTGSTTITVTAEDPTGLTGNVSFILLKQDISDPSIFAYVLNGENGLQLGGGANPQRGSIDISGIGDFNNDGFDDYVISGSDLDVNGFFFAGKIFVVYGNTDEKVSFSLGSITTATGFTISGTDGSESMGRAVGGGSDLNNDGIADLVFNNKFRTYVLFGGTTISDVNFDLTTLDGTNGYTITSEAGDIKTLGDVNGDGIDDVIIGSTIVFGAATNATTIDASSLSTRGFKINKNGIVGRAGDVNNDGFDDIIVGMPDESPSDRDSDGIAYVLYGSTSLSGTIDLNAINSTQGFKMFGKNDTGNRSADFGYSVDGVGDFNGDGIDDIVVGSRSLGGRLGEAYVIYGNTTSPGTLDMSALTATQGLTIQGFSIGSFGGIVDVGETGTSVSGAGDFDGDGLNDIILGSPFSNQTRGEATIIYGSSSYGALVKIDQLPYTATARVKGFDSGFGKLGIRVANAGDVDNDGFDDVVIGTQNGKSFVIYGRSIPNANPTVANALPDLLLQQGFGTQTIDLSNVFTDPEGDALTFTARSTDSDKAEASVSVTILTLTEVSETGGPFNIVVTAEDTNRGTVSDEFELVVNAPPTVITLNGTSISENEPVDTEVGFFMIDDANDQSHTITLSGTDASQFTFVDTPNHPHIMSNSVFDFETRDSYAITVTADDQKGGTLSQDFTIMIRNVNEATTVANPIDDIILSEGFTSATLDITNTFLDEDGDPLTFSVFSDDNSVVNISSSGTLVTLTEGTIRGMTNVTITAEDGNGGIASDVVSVTVIENNLPIVASSLVDMNLEEGFGNQILDITNVFTDADGDVLTFTISVNEPLIVSASVTDTNLTLSEGTQRGTATITIIADDGKGGTATDEFEVVISERILAISDEETVLVYPNPFQSLLHIGIEEAIKSIQLFNIQGEILIEKLEVINSEMNLQQLNKGIYFLRITLVSGETKEIKLMKQ